MFHCVDKDFLFAFMRETETKQGGYSKVPGVGPDLMHTYLGIAALALADHPMVQPIHPALNISKSSHEYLVELHKKHAS